jgi:hypothetical protein
VLPTLKGAGRQSPVWRFISAVISQQMELLYILSRMYIFGCYVGPKQLSTVDFVASAWNCDLFRRNIA